MPGKASSLSNSGVLVDRQVGYWPDRVPFPCPFLRVLRQALFTQVYFFLSTQLASLSTAHKACCHSSLWSVWAGLQRTTSLSV